jgi:hypothetical protein
VLTVGVQGDGVVITLPKGVAQAGLDGTPGTQLHRQRETQDAVPLHRLAGAVAAGVVHHHYVEVRAALDLAQHAVDAVALVEGGDDDQTLFHCPPPVPAMRR